MIYSFVSKIFKQSAMCANDAFSYMAFNDPGLSFDLDAFWILAPCNPEAVWSWGGDGPDALSAPEASPGSLHTILPQCFHASIVHFLCL